MAAPDRAVKAAEASLATAKAARVEHDGVVSRLDERLASAREAECKAYAAARKAQTRTPEESIATMERRMREAQERLTKARARVAEAAAEAQAAQQARGVTQRMVEKLEAERGGQASRRRGRR
ncbi:MAG: hypothetical protein AB1730_15290 [Myxococcota bacterium]